jgi:hypothetical protein
VLSNRVRAARKVTAFVIPTRSKKKVKDGLIFSKERLLFDLMGEADDLWRLHSGMIDASQNTERESHTKHQNF